jgi:formylglycine-generating enzyme required for sulfatase activity
VAGGSLPPNRFGLHETHGNLFEWCADIWHEDYNGAPTRGEAWTRGGGAERVLRGGSWHDPPNLCRSAARLKYDPREGEDFFGFRVALASEQEALPAD